VLKKFFYPMIAAIIIFLIFAAAISVSNP